MAIIKTLKDKIGNIIYPQTKASAVFMANNTTVESMLANFPVKKIAKLWEETGTQSTGAFTITLPENNATWLLFQYGLAGTQKNSHILSEIGTSVNVSIAASASSQNYRNLTWTNKTTVSVSAANNTSYPIVIKAIYGIQIGTGEIDNSPVLLWTNPNPTATFATQTINLDLSAYRMIMLQTRVHIESDYNALQNNLMFVDGEMYSIARFKGDNNASVYKRQFTPTTTGLIVGAGYRDTSASNGSCIPTKIYGIK